MDSNDRGILTLLAKGMRDLRAQVGNLARQPGPAGKDGQDGKDGLDGKDGIGLRGLAGTDGADGADGARGPDGPQGAPGANGAILAGSNIASVVRNSTGTYTITFATAMPNTNYSVLVTPRSADDAEMWSGQETKASAHSTTAITVAVRSTAAVRSSALADPASCSVVVRGTP